MEDWTSEGIFGGAYNKVIRWSFEKQGEFQPIGAPTPVTTPGDPEPMYVISTMVDMENISFSLFIGIIPPFGTEEVLMVS